MISEEEIRNIAKISYLEIKDEEIKELKEKFSLILNYFEKIKELDTENVSETSSILKTENVMRCDFSEKNDNSKLLESFSKKENGYLEVNKILYNED
jgi:aspartyl-tRNA(Asn)/glutamyl-tRNA(Gln) amidotransferase subunit C